MGTAEGCSRGGPGKRILPIKDDVKDFTGELPVAGWDGKHEWQGYVPDSEQPHLRNPQKGYIVNANNKVAPDGYPYVITKYYATPDRFVRIQEMIEDKKQLSIEDFEKMQVDVLMVMAREWVPLIIQALNNVELSKTETAALSTLEKWDYTARHDQSAPAVFNVFMNYIAENTFKKGWVPIFTNNMLPAIRISRLMLCEDSSRRDNPPGLMIRIPLKKKDSARYW